MTKLLSCSKAVRIELYSSYSPCNKCCKLIQDFLHRRPECQISIAFTCVFLHYEPRHSSALVELCKHDSVIRMDVFRKQEWETLQNMELVALTPQQQQEMRVWDEYWRNILDGILGRRRIRLLGAQVSQVLIINERLY